MSIQIAEYYGQRIRRNSSVNKAPENAKCPFMHETKCHKANSSKTAPVCSIYKDGRFFATCPKRSFGTNQTILLSQHQKKFLDTLSQYIFPYKNSSSEILYETEAKLADHERADIVLREWNASGSYKNDSPTNIVTEIQVSGGTLNTYNIYNVVRDWEEGCGSLMTPIKNVSLNLRGTWTQLQDQLLRKGRLLRNCVAGSGFAACISTFLFDFIMDRIQGSNLPDLRNKDWTFALIAIDETPTRTMDDFNTIPIGIDESRTLFTSYDAFADTLTKYREECDRDAFSPVFLKVL